MEERNVVVRDNGGSMAAFSLIAVIVVVGLIALFVWQPWNSNTGTSRTNTTQTTTGTGTTTGGTTGGTTGSSTTGH